MITFLLLIIPIIFILISKLKVGTFKNPTSIVATWWGGWAFLSLFGLLGLYIPSNDTYLLILLFIIFFSIGNLVSIKKYKTEQITINNELTNIAKKKLSILYYLQFIVFLILIPYLIKAIPNIMSMDSSTYRLALFDSDILYQSSNVRLLLFDIILEPLINLGILLGIVGFYLNYKTKKILLMSILNAIIFSVMTLGRWYFLKIILFLIIGFIIISQFKRIIPRNVFKKNKRILFFIIPITSIAMVIMSFIRAGKEESILFIAYEYLIRYFTAPFIALDTFIHNLHMGEFYFGRVTFTPLDTIFVYFTRRFDDSVVNISESISHYTRDFIDIGNGYTHNAFYTSIYNFYLDGGIIALIIISLVLGIIVGVTYNKFSQRPNLFTASLLILLIYITVIATLRWEFINLWPMVVIIYLFLLITKVGSKKIKREEHEVK